MAHTIHFPTRARRDDPNGHMTVMEMLEFLKGEVEAEFNSILAGNDTVAQGATTKAVTHDAVPANHSVVASPQVSPGGYWWISGITSTGFQLNLAVAAPIGGVPFGWIVKGV